MLFHNHLNKFFLFAIICGVIFEKVNTDQEEESGNLLLETRPATARKTFTGYKLYKINATAEDDLNMLKKLFEEHDLDFWRQPNPNEPAEVLVEQEEEMQLKELLDAVGIKYSIVIDDVESVVSKQYRGLKNSRGKPMTWTDYHYPEDMLGWMDRLSSTRSGLYVNSSVIGKTLEDRPVTLIKISSGDSSKKQGVFIDGGIHAREWISSAVATYIVNELTHNSEQHDALLKRYDFYIIPLLNPDGYAYSVNYNRFWRKSRREVQSVASWFGCRGVDLNRNFGYNWGGRGSGRQACSLVYGGTEAFSEPESASIRDFVEQHSEIDWVAYFSLHAFGQKWMTPWGNTREVPDDYDELIRVGQIGVEALRAVHGTRYRLGSSSNIMYAASGASADWFKGVVGVKYSYTLELRDYGLFGFLLPSSQIEPTAEETWAGIQAALLAIPEK